MTKKKLESAHAKLMSDSVKFMAEARATILARKMKKEPTATTELTKDELRVLLELLNKCIESPRGSDLRYHFALRARSKVCGALEQLAPKKSKAPKAGR
jgi:hypothetical protein